MDRENLLGGPPETLLPEDPAARLIADGTAAVDAARAQPTSSLAWAELAEAALADGEDVRAYAFARTGYHRGLDALRRAGWRGFGPVPWGHTPNQGFLRAVAALARAAAEIDEVDEAERCRQLLADSDHQAVAELLG
ncbi:MAG: DUF3151 domain-containing protein [Nocardioidaceae bacterium]|nr:DUF3151 domain-containing protein [Nocardioidaceae bacterium]